MTDILHPDGVAIDFRAPGPLVIRGGQFGNGNQPIPRIRLRDAYGSYELVDQIFDLPTNTRRDVRIVANVFADNNGLARVR
jgi:hypothetical protein